MDSTGPVAMKQPLGVGEDGPAGRRLVLRLDAFAWQAISNESADHGMSPEDFAKYAVLYYLADLDRGRIARRIPPPWTERRGA
jgi:hypothetical protein